jgi:hypothetical protein
MRQSRLLVDSSILLAERRRDRDSGSIATTDPNHRLRIRRPGICAACGRELAIGEEAAWDGASQALACIDCDRGVRVVEGQAGASALREYERRRLAREQHARERLGGPGVLMARVIKEPQSTTAWKQGARGEVRTGERLAKLLGPHGVRILHDRRIPGHAGANIDHLTVGPGGVTVIDTKTHRGKVSVERIGGLISPRHSVLKIGGRDQTKPQSTVWRRVGR